MRGAGKNSVLRSTAGLALAGIVSKAVGAFYRIPLTNVLGAEGIGLYQTFFPVYALFLTFTSAALPTVVGRYVAYSDALGIAIPETRAAAKRVAFALGATGLVFTALLAYPVAALQSRPQVWQGYLIVAPAVLAVTLSAYYKGYFIGKGRMTSNALSQTAEQAVKLAVGLTAAYLLAPKGIVLAVYGALFAVTASEAAGLFFMAAAYGKDVGKSNNFPVRVDKRIYYDIIRTMFPIAAAALVVPVSGFIDSFLIVRLLAAGGEELSSATAAYGIYSGAVGTVINLPVVVAISLAVAVIPRVSAGVAKGEYVGVNKATGLTLGAGLAVAVPCFFALLILSDDVINLLYPGFSAEEAGRAAELLKIQSFNVIAASLVQLLCGILQALGAGRSAACYLAVSVALKTAVQAVLLPRMGIVAAPIAQLTMYALANVLALVRYTELVGKNTQLAKSVSKIALGGVIMGVCVRVVSLVVNGGAARLALSALIGGAAYFATLALTGAFGKEALSSIFGRAAKGE